MMKQGYRTNKQAICAMAAVAAWQTDLFVCLPLAHGLRMTAVKAGHGPDGGGRSF